MTGVIWERCFAWLGGYLSVLIQGPYPERLLNLITNYGSYLWDVRRLSDRVIIAKIKAGNFLKIKELVRRSGCQLSIHRKRGCPFWRRKLERRKVFILGLLGFLIWLSYCSSMVLFIKVIGFEGKPRQQLVKSLGKVGLRPGILRSELLQKKSLIEQEVMLENTQMLWLSITVRGVVAEVRVVPRQTVNLQPGYQNIVATNDGRIEKIILIRGVPVVKEGDTVARGDLLITGSDWRVDPESGELTKEELAACGIIEARVWYRFEAEEPKIVWRPIKGRILRNTYGLRWRDKLWPIIGFGPKINGNYDLTRWRKRIYQGRNPLDVVEIIKDTWQETTWRRVLLPRRDLRRAALAEVKAKSGYLKGLKQTDRALTWSETAEFLNLTLTVETRQDIGNSR